MFKIIKELYDRLWFYLRAKVTTAMNVADLREGSLRASPAISKSFKPEKCYSTLLIDYMYTVKIE